MASTDIIVITTCAACGKEGGDSLKACTACKLVKYCNRECQIAHRPLHKKACKKRVAELHDEALFKEPPPREDCPICFLPLPLDGGQLTFKSCCGKLICNGCIYAMLEEARGRRVEIGLCAFCRKPTATSAEEDIKRTRKLMENDNTDAFYNLAARYEHGTGGMPQDFERANELYLRAGELGCAEGYFNLGNSYYNGRGVEVDKKKAKHYCELAAMNGDVNARHNLGFMDGQAGKYHRGMKHLILAASAGHKESLDKVKEGFMDGMIAKDEYANTLRANHKIQDEMKSDARDKVAALRSRHPELMH